MLKPEDILKLNLGFKKGLMSTDFSKEVGRGRTIQIGSLGDTCEMVVIIEKPYFLDSKSNKADMVVVHNYDYDGHLTIEKLLAIVRIFAMSNKKKSLS